MASKTISLEIDAYERLKAARLEGESFSQAVRRLVPAAPGRAVDLLATVKSGEFGRGVDWAAVDRVTRRGRPLASGKSARYQDPRP